MSGFYEPKPHTVSFLNALAFLLSFEACDEGSQNFNKTLLKLFDGCNSSCSDVR